MSKKTIIVVLLVGLALASIYLAFAQPAEESPEETAYFPPAVAKVYIVSFRSHDDRRPSKFIVLADKMRSAIKNGLGTWRGGLPIAF